MDMHANRMADEAARDRKLGRIDGAMPTVKRRRRKTLTVANCGQAERT
jgi:hypothetical protein